MAALYLFLLGLASGIGLLTLSAYRHVSPGWLRWLLMSLGAFVISRYAVLAAFAAAEDPHRLWVLRHCWLASSIGLTVPGVFAVDQLVRHPAISAKKLLRWCSPFLAVYAAVILFGQFTTAQDPWLGWMLHLTSPWHHLLSVVQSVFVLGYLGLCVLLIRKIPSRPIQTALAILAVSYGYLGLDGVLLALGRFYFRPFLFSEMFALLALWHAYETAARLQTAS